LPTCFVVMPFAKEFDAVLERAILPACAAAGYECRRADDPSRPGSIMKEVVQSIFSSHAIIADLSTLNANVLYELGIAHAIADKTVMICDRSVKRLPFDLGDYRTLFYARSERGLKDLRETLADALKKLPVWSSRPTNPVRQFGPDRFVVPFQSASDDEALSRLFAFEGKVAVYRSAEMRQGRLFVRESDSTLVGFLARHLKEPAREPRDPPALEEAGTHLIVIGSTRFNPLAEQVQRFFALPYGYVFARAGDTPADRTLRIVTEYGDELSASRDNFIDRGGAGVDYGILFVGNLSGGKRIFWISGIHGLGSLGVYGFLKEHAAHVASEVDALGGEEDAGVSWLLRVHHERRSTDAGLEGIEAEALGSPARCRRRSTAARKRALLVDLGGVIVDFDRTRSYRAIAHSAGLPFGEVRGRIESTDLRARYERGEMDDERFCREIVQLFPEAGAGLLDLLPEFWGDIFWPNMEIFEALRLLKEQGVVLVLLSNTNPLHFRQIERDYPDLIALLDKTVVSYEERALKPELQIYTAALGWLHREHRIPPSDALYVDDIEEYVEQARGLGIPGFVYRSYPHLIFWLRGQGVYVP